MCCVVSVFAPFTHSVDQPSQIVSLLPLLLFPACPFFTQHNAHTFVSTVLRGSFAHKLHAHDLYKLNAAILLNAYACFRFYFLCAALIAFFSLQFIITHSSCTVFSLWSMFRGNNFCSLCFCCGDYCYCKRDFYSKLFLWCTRFFAIFASISAVYMVHSYDFIFFSHCSEWHDVITNLGTLVLLFIFFFSQFFSHKSLRNQSILECYTHSSKWSSQFFFFYMSGGLWRK